MIKRIKLSYFLNKAMFKQNKLAFIIFMLVQIIISIGFVYFLSTIIHSRTEYMKSFDSTRCIEVTLNKNYTESEISGIADSINSSGLFKSAVVYFGDENSKIDDSGLFMAYVDTGIGEGSVIGTAITEEDIKQKRKVIVMVDEQDPDKEEFKYKEGDIIDVKGESFTMIGYRTDGYYPEIPYTVGAEKMTVVKTQFIANDFTSEDNLDEHQQFIQGLFPEGFIHMPRDLNVATIRQLTGVIMASSFAFICAIFNFLLVFKYMMEKSSFTYNVLRLCGSKRASFVSIILLQLMTLYIASYSISVIAFEVFVKGFVRTRSTLEVTVAVFIFSFVMIALIIFPYIIKYSKDTIKNQLNNWG